MYVTSGQNAELLLWDSQDQPATFHIIAASSALIAEEEWLELELSKWLTMKM